MNQILKNEEKIIFALRQLYAGYGYRPYKMSRFEEYDLYVQNRDFLLSDQIITFSDRSGKLLALKPDVTLSIIKNVQDVPGKVQKHYYNENVYRVDKDTQSFKEIMQAGLECVGDLTAYETTEAVLLAAKSLALIGRPFVLDISHIGFLNAVFDSSGLFSEKRERALTLLHQKNTHEMAELCYQNGCADEACAILCLLASLSGNGKETLPDLKKLVYTDAQTAALQELEQICDVLAAQGFEDAINIDFSAGSQMKYYSGIVFSGYLQGIPNVVLSGGQYDKLMQKMKKNCKAIGFAIYLDLLQRVQENESTVDVNTVLLYNNQDTAVIMEICDQLRNEGSVLAATEVPGDITFRRLMRIENGEAVLIEYNS